MKITVAIPCYNLQDRISECLESAIAQDYKDIEILVIDDCSTDKSVEVINCLIDLHPEREFRLIVNETNLGLCEVRNIAIKEARGEALYYLDGDDTIEPGTISLFQRRMEETNAEVVSGSYKRMKIRGNTTFSKQYPDDTINGGFALATYFRKHLTNDRVFSVGVTNRLYSLDFLRYHEICCSTDYRTYEASLFTFKVALHARHISYLTDITYNYFIVPNSITHQKKDQAFIHAVQACTQSVFDEKRDFENKNKEQITHTGLLLLLSYCSLNNTKIRDVLKADVDKNEKKQFLRWLKRVCHENGMRWSSIVGVYNKVIYLLLISPFSYSLLHYYYSHRKTVSRIVDYFIKRTQ